MVVAATRPILNLIGWTISSIARVIPLGGEVSFFFTTLTVGPLLGSLITEPAAMTVTALILKQRYFDRGMSTRFLYTTLSVLFVNVSIGGVLTNFAAPPVLMVADIWGWDSQYMLTQFGWKAMIGVFLNASLATTLFHKEIRSLKEINQSDAIERKTPRWLVFTHVIFLSLIVFTSHHPAFFLGLFLFFLGISAITVEYQDELKLKESLLVSFFLAGLVVLGNLQSWWLRPLLTRLEALPLFVGTTALTAFLDNAALTYLGAQVSGISDTLKYALVAGAVAGGGITVIANAPNPAGFSILRSSFGEEGISPLRILLFSMAPTLISMGCFWLL